MTALANTAPALFATLLFAVPVAHAYDPDVHHGPDHNQISGVRGEVHLGADYYSSLGVGLRLEIPIVADGFIGGNVRDELALVPGIEFFGVDYYPGYYDYGPYIMPLLVFNWNFYLGDRWSIYPEAGLAFHAGFADYGGDYRRLYIAPAAGFGARYHFSSRNSLSLRISTPAGLQVGLTF